MARLTLILLFIIGLTVTVKAQFSMERYLSNSVQAIEIKSVQNQQQFIKQNTFRSPILREVEFRMRATRLEEGVENYKLRFSPLNPFERSANKNYAAVIEDQMQVEFKWTLNEVLENRYELLIKHYFIDKQQQITNKQLEFYNELLSMVRQQPHLFSLKDIIRTDKTILRAKLKIEELNSSQAQLEFLIKQTYPYQGEMRWEENSLVSAQQILDWLALQNKPLIDNNLFIKNELKKELLAESAFKVKKQESFSNIGYLQAEYREDADRTFGQNIGIQLAVTIPIVNPDKPDLARRQLRLLESSQELEEEKTSIRTTINFYRLQLNGVIRQHTLVQEKQQEYLTNAISTRRGSTSLDILIEFREFQFDLDKDELRLYVEILNYYISLLSYEGKLATSPYINYLSATKNIFNIDL